MTSINSKLGLKPAGKRAMMQLPDDRALRIQITSAVCPACGRTGARLSKIEAHSLYCTYCNTRWPLPALDPKGVAAMSTDPREPPPPVTDPESSPTSVPDEDDRGEGDDTSDTDEAEREHDLSVTVNVADLDVEA